MRFKAIIVATALALIAGHASALSMLSSPISTDQEVVTTEEPEIVALGHEDKARLTGNSALSDINKALSSNRKQRAYLIELNHDVENDVELDALLKVLDMRFSMLTVAGDGIIRAKTEVEIKEATALAEAIMQTTTDISEAIEESWSYDAQAKETESDSAGSE